MSKQSRDRAADVLILIDQYEPVFLAVSVRQFPLAFENSDRERDQIGEIDALARGLFFFIEAKDSQELARGLLVQRGTGFPVCPWLELWMDRLSLSQSPTDRAPPPMTRA